MMIWKYTLAMQTEQEIEMPADASILSVGTQNDEVQLWALVEPSMPKQSRKIFLFGTGHPVNEFALRFVGTALTHGGSLVWHIFEPWKRA